MGETVVLRTWRRMPALLLATAVAGAVVVCPPTVAAAADPWDPYAEGLQNSNAVLPYPAFVNADQAIPPVSAAYDPATSYLQRVFDAEVASGAGTAPNNDFWIDRMLKRDGVQTDEPGGLNFSTHAAENIDYDNNAILFTKGSALYMEDSSAGLGFRGDVAYIDTLGGRSAYTLDVKVGSGSVTLTEDTTKRHNTPSYWYSEFTGGGLRVKQAKFITQNNVAAEWLQVATTDGSTKSVELTAASSYATTATGNELTGTVTAPHGVTSVATRLSGDQFTVNGTSLRRTITATATAANIKLQMGFTTTEIPASTSDYDAMRTKTPQAAFTDQTRTYNQWWVDNIPYVATPEGSIDKSVFYRWWLLRTNFLDANIPGNDYQFPTSIEGIYQAAYDNAIVLTAGMFIDDMKYFRDPSSAYGTWLSAGEVARSGRYIDNPGNPVNWSSSYANYISDAAWRSYQIHGGNPSVAGKLAQYAAADAKGQLKSFDSNNNGLIEYSNPAMTGNDLDAVSFSWQSTANWGSYAMDRPESAYVYAGAKAAAQGFRVSGRNTEADEMDALAAKVKQGVLNVLWENKRTSPDEMGLYGNLLKAAYSVQTPSYSPGYKIPWKEVNSYYPFSVGLMPKPGDSDFNQKYLDALRLFVDQRQFSPFPFHTANQADAADRARRITGREFFNNFSTINSTVLFRLLSSVLRDYPNTYLTSDYYKKLLYWNAWAIYEKGDVTRQDENEFWAHGSAENGGSIKYRSWIQQTQLGTTNFTVIEDVAGLQARTDQVLELSPIDIGWDHFTVNNLKYHDQDLTIVWDKPSDGTDHYPGAPEGYSAYIGGRLAFTIDALKPVTFDTATGQTTTVATVLSSAAAPVQAAQDVRFANTDRVVDLLAKAGVDVDSRSSDAPQLAEGRTVRASFTATGTTGGGNTYAAAGAVNGSTVNEPFWGTAGSPNNSDWLEVDLGAARTVDEAQVYFYRTSSSGTVTGYSAPANYAVQYWNGTKWVGVTGQYRAPAVPTGNRNLVRFAQVTTTKIRVVVTHQGTTRTGIKELQVRNSDVPFTPATNTAPTVTVNQDGSFSQPGRARFIGAVGDDGLPSGDLTQTWTVVSAPTDARVSFTNPSAPSTVATFSLPGAYQLSFSASDGEKSTTSTQTVTVADNLPPGPDVSSYATPTASYVPTWNRVAAVNDGNTTAGSDQTLLWGTYRDGTRPTSDWVSYGWTSPTRVSSAQAYFWNDTAQGSGAGVALPASWKVEYLDQFGSWQSVSATTTYPVKAMVGGVPQPSRVTFRPVVTTQVRVTFQASPNAANTNRSAVAVSELDLFSENPDSIETLAVKTQIGRPVALPAQVTAVFPDGRRESVKAEWNTIDGSQYETFGRFTATGTVAGSTHPIEATISVSEAGDDIGGVSPQTAHTYVNAAPDLPTTAVVTLTGGNGALESRPVEWEPVAPSQYSQPGSFEISGVIENTNVAVDATVTIDHDPLGDAPGAPSNATVNVGTDSATLTWTRWTSTPDVAATGTEVIVARLGGTVASRQTLASDKSSVVLSSLSAGEYTAHLRTTSANGTSDLVELPFVVAAAPAAPLVTLSPGTADGDNGWYRSAPQLTAKVPDTNIAVGASPTASYTATHNRINGLNDGAVFYTGTYGSLSEADSQTKVWGTWTASDRAATQTVQYKWATNKRISSSTVHFWTDRSDAGAGGGVAMPSSWKLQYLKPSGSWADVEVVGAYPANRTSPNAVTFAPVTTKALRLVLVASTDGSTNAAVAVAEWDVQGVEASSVVEAQINAGSWQPVGSGIRLDTEGAQDVKVRAQAANGLTSTIASTALKLDSEAPTASATFDDQGGQADGPVSVTLSGMDATSGVESLSYSLDSGAWTTPAGPVLVSGPGVHRLEYRAKDRAGNTSSTLTATITIRAADTVAPVVTATTNPVIASGASGWFTGPVSVVLDASDDASGVDSVEYQISAGVWRIYSGPVPLDPGVQQVSFRATDRRGNVSAPQLISVKRDLLAPTVTAEYDDGAGTSEGPVAVTLIAIDDISGVASVSYQLDGAGWQPYRGPFDVTAAGVHTVDFMAADIAGHVSASSSATVRVAAPDSTAPTVQASMTPGVATGLAGWFTGEVQVTLEATDDRSGVASVEYAANGSGWQPYLVPITVPEGVTTVSYRATDTKGNVSAPADVTIHRDATAPQSLASFDDQDGNAAGPVQVTLTATDAVAGAGSTRYTVDGGAEQVYSGPFEVRGGTVTIRYWSVDLAGNTESVKTAVVRLRGEDNTAPVISHAVSPAEVDGANGWYVGAVAVTLLATDERSGVASLEYRTGGEDWQPYTAALTPAEGTTAYEYRAVDGAGNAAAPQTLTVKRDTVVPRSELTQTGSGTTGRPVTITLASSDASSGVDAVNYRVDAGAWQTYEAAFTLAEPGTHTVEYGARDVAGNLERVRSAALVVGADKVAPTVVITADPAPDGSGGWYRTAPAVSATASDASGVALLQYKATGGTWATYEPGDSLIPGEGTTTYSFRARDTKGNLSAPVATTVLFDGTAPVSRASFNDRSGSSSAPVPVTLTSTDTRPGSQVASIAYSVDGASWTVYNGVFRVAGSGTHVVRFASTDIAGNVEAAQTVTVRIAALDTDPPFLSVATDPAEPTGSAGWFTSAVSMTASATDAGSGLRSIQYRVGSGDWRAYTGLVAAPVGVTTYSIKATDKAGNVSETRQVTVKRDVAKPLVTASKPASRRGPVPVTVSATDAHSGVARISFSLDGGGWTAYAEPVVVSGGGSHTLLVKAEDVAGNISVIKTVTIGLIG